VRLPWLGESRRLLGLEVVVAKRSLSDHGQPSVVHGWSATRTPARTYPGRADVAALERLREDYRLFMIEGVVGAPNPPVSRSDLPMYG